MPILYLQPLGHLAHGMILAKTSLQDLDMELPTQRHLTDVKTSQNQPLFFLPQMPFTCSLPVSVIGNSILLLGQVRNDELLLDSSLSSTHSIQFARQTWYSFLQIR